MSTSVELMRSWCHPEPPPKPKPTFTCTPTTRRQQYRRTEDEDAGGLADCHFGPDGEVSLEHYERTGEVRLRAEPQLAATVAVAVVPPDVYDGLAPELVAIARPLVERFQERVDARAFPAVLSDDARRSIVACIYHMRHANRMPLRLESEKPTDPALPGYDLPDSIRRLIWLYKEEIMARAGHRTLAHGVFPIDPRNPSKGYRVQIWDTSKEHKSSTGEVVIGGKLHIAYKKTEEAAWDTLAEWFLKNRKIDVRKYTCYHPQSAIAVVAKLWREAARLHNDFREVSVKELWAGTDEEEDWD